jgi:ankyrin repeat protein
MLASYHGHLEAVRMLLDKGADANVLNDRGQSIVAGAVFKGEHEVVKALFENGADVRKGQPNAIDSAKMFKRNDMLTLFGEESS